MKRTLSFVVLLAALSVFAQPQFQPTGGNNPSHVTIGGGTNSGGTSYAAGAGINISNGIISTNGSAVGTLVTNVVTTNTGNGSTILAALGGASLTANQTMSGNTVHSGNDSVTGTLNAGGGNVTNLDSSVINVRDYGSSIYNAWKAATNGAVSATERIYDPINYIGYGVLTTPLYFTNTTFTGLNLSADPPIRLSGNGPAMTDLQWNGTANNQAMFDQRVSGLTGNLGLDIAEISPERQHDEHLLWLRERTGCRRQFAMGQCGSGLFHGGNLRFA